MTTQQLRFLFLLVAIGASASAIKGTAEAEAAQGADLRPPAGQMCPSGFFVTGFDQGGNIICGEAVSNEAAGSTASTAPVIAAPASSGGQELPSAAAAAVVTSPAVAASHSTGEPAMGAALTIEEVKPWSAPYGSREVDLVISGSGFADTTMVVFQGEPYKPSVDPSGTRLAVTVRTRHLAMGTYPLTVVNGEEDRVTLKKGLVIF